MEEKQNIINNYLDANNVSSELQKTNIEIKDELKRQLEDNKYLILNKKQRLVKKFYENQTFYNYCMLVSSFHRYNKDKPYIKQVCQTLEDFYDNKLLNSMNEPYMFLILSMPPRFGKSYTLQLYNAYHTAFKDRQNQVIYVSYNREFATDACSKIRDIMTQDYNKKGDMFLTTNDFFNEDNKIELQRGKNKSNKFAIKEQQENTLLAGAPKSGITGQPAKNILIDDLVKNNEEALNINYMQKLQIFYQETLLQRLVDQSDTSNNKVIILQTQWSEYDLIGYYTKEEYKDIYYQLKLPALINFYEVYGEEKAEPIMLNDNVMGFKMFNYKKLEADKNPISKAIFYAIYQQEIIDTGLTVYNFDIENYYKEIPKGGRIVAYIDPCVSSGNDDMCIWIAKQIINPLTKARELYILDCYSDNIDLELNTLNVAQLIVKWKVTEAIIELNNGGEFVYKAVDKMIRKSLKYTYCNLRRFNQRGNKEYRVLGNAPDVCLYTFLPENFYMTHKHIFDHLITFKTSFKHNKHDDIEDALTGLYEHFGNKGKTLTDEQLQKLSNML